MPSKKLIRVVIADDSLVAREMLSQILATDPCIEVVGQAKDGAEAVEMVANLRPDLVTMDIHMPRMDGLTATEKIMAFTPTPILVVSSSVHGEGMGSAFDALARGALEVIKKPEPKDWVDLERIGREVLRKVKVLANVRVITHITGRRGHAAAPVADKELARTDRRIVAIGSSTGGPSALLTVLAGLPADFPLPVLVAQHIADGFVPGLVSWLNGGTKVNVVAAAEGDRPRPGTVYFATTGSNMVIQAGSLRFEPPGAGQLYIPSADVLFESVSYSFGSRAVGVLLTGMGADGAQGLKRMKERGAATIAQNEETCTVYGMPRAAIELGAVDKVLAIEDVAEGILQSIA